MAESGIKLDNLSKLESTRDRFNYKNDYQVENLAYPIDLFGSIEGPNSDTDELETQYGNNYTVFYINIAEDSKLLTQNKEKTVDDLTQRDYGRLAGKNYSAGQAAVGSATEGAIAAGALTSLDFKKTITTGGIAAAGVGVIASTTNSFSKKLKRLTAAIALHTPNTLSEKYTANYEDTNTATFELAMRGAEEIAKSFESSIKSGKLNISDSLKSGVSNVALNLIPGKDSISVMTGIAPNPKKEQAFKGVDFRSWTYEYQFFPRSKQEYNNVQNIIYLFKLHMHPEFKDTDNFLYVYPAEFDIVHYHGIDENLNLPRHASCVLTDFTVNYAPQTQFTSFEEGIPSQINISMSFRELVQVTKERILEGF